MLKQRSFFTEQKEMYKQPVESSGTAISPQQQEELDEYRQYLASAKSNQEELKRKRDWFLKKDQRSIHGFQRF